MLYNNDFLISIQYITYLEEAKSIFSVYRLHSRMKKKAANRTIKFQNRQFHQSTVG